MPPLVLRVEVNIDAIAREIDKVIADITGSGDLEGQLLNTAVVGTRKNPISLFALLDNGTHAHNIPLGKGGYLANPDAEGKGDKGFIVRSSVNHPGTPPHDISARATTYFESALQRKLVGSSTRALINRTSSILDFTLVRATFVEALEQTKRYAETITPANWTRVKTSYETRLNKRKI